MPSNEPFNRWKLPSYNTDGMDSVITAIFSEKSKDFPPYILLSGSVKVFLLLNIIC